MPTKARAMAYASVASALGVAALYLGSVLPSARLSILCAATLGVAFVKMSCPGWWSLGCYAVTASLALLLTPDKTLPVLYTLFFGYYPIVKLRAERFSDPRIRWGVKLGAFHAALGALLLLLRSASFLPSALEDTALWLLWIGGVVFFLVYDFVLGKLFLYYLRNIAGRMK